MTEQQKQKLREIARWRQMSFPNGSAYKQQYLPEGDFGDVTVTLIYNQGWRCQWANGTTTGVGLGRTSVGAGVNLGVHYCSKDQALADLL